MTKQEYIDTFFSIFPKKIMYKDFNYNRIEGVFYIPNFTFKNKYIFYDIIMNDNLFSSMMSIDEHTKATKDKKDIYIHFINDNVGKLTANITEQINKGDDKYLKNLTKEDRLLFDKSVKSYVRIKVSIPDSPKKNIDYNTKINIKQIQLFQEIFSKYLSIYDKKYKEIFDIYSLYIKDFSDFSDFIEEDTIKDIDIKNTKLKKIIPDLFINNYSTICQNKPNIIDINDINDIGNIEYVMKFPKDGDIETPVSQQYYTCSHNETHKFPGLIENNLYNKNIYKYVPCCFKINQKEKQSSKYNKYLNGVDEKIDSVQQKIIVKNKILDFGKYGKLSDNLNKIFNIFDDDNKIFSYKRKGINSSINSFIDCVYESMEFNIIEDREERNIYINELRKKFETNEYASLCKQEMYNFSIENIIEKIKSNDYFDPKYFIRILEYEYNCKIFIFNDDELLSRDVKNKLYEENNNNNAVFIYQHKDNICDLIIKNKNNDTNDNDYSFPIESNIYKNMNDIYNKINITKQHINLNEIFDIKWQYIDAYGKTRMLCIKFNEIFIVLFTSPLQPLYCRTIEKDDDELKNITQTSKNIGLFLESIKNKKIKKNDKKNLTFVLNHITFNIYKKFDNISVLKKYNKYNRLSKYIMEYFYWLYSCFLNDDSIKNKSFDKFCSIYINIDKNFEYDLNKLNNEFNKNNNGIMLENKLIIKSTKTLKKMYFLLDLMYKRYPNKLLDYCKLKYIGNYYTEITDFDNNTNQSILYGLNTIDKILQ